MILASIRHVKIIVIAMAYAKKVNASAILTLAVSFVASNFVLTVVLEMAFAKMENALAGRNSPAITALSQYVYPDAGRSVKASVMNSMSAFAKKDGEEMNAIASFANPNAAQTDYVQKVSVCAKLGSLEQRAKQGLA